MKIIQKIKTYLIPYQFLNIAQKGAKYSGWISIILFIAGIYLSFNAPPDYQQGYAVSIMFVHVPAAWCALFTYTIMAICSAIFFISRLPIADIIARNLAPIGITFTCLALATGAIWGKPIWGVWWAWDSRLISVFILLLLYLGYIALRHAIEDNMRAAQICAIFALAGFIDIPIIKFSVDWWHSLHQPASISIFKMPTIHISLLIPLFVMTSAYMTLLICLTLKSVQTDINKTKLNKLERNSI